MDPASIVGLAASTVTLLGLLGQGVLSVKAMLHGVRDVHENTRGFGEELDAFHFSLTILDFEIRNGSLIPEIQGWWGATKLDALLTNARKTFSRLETIFHDIQRQRLILQRPREHIRTNLYDREIGHLRLRINTYTLAFNIPVVLLAIHGTRSPNTQMDQNLNLSLLVDRISQLEEGITSISNDIRTFSDGYVANEPTGSPQVESPIRRESEELVGIARTLVSDASSVAASESAQSPPSTVRAFDPAPTPEDPRATPQQGSSDIAECANVGESGHDASCSVAGVPLTTQRRMRVEAWISQPQATRSHSSVPSDPSSMPDIASITFTETSNFSEALHTPPSTINSQDGGDIEAELTEKRYKRARDLMEQQKFREAIPHLKRTLGAIKTVGENPVFQGTREYQKAQYLLATALMGADPNSAEAGTILVELFESRGSQPLERLSAAHLLAQLYLNQHPDDCTEAKKMCLTAVKGRNATLGRTHPETYASIALLCSICQVSNDSDEEVWRDMLYEAQRRHNTDEWKEQRNESPRYRTLEGHSSLVYSVVFSSDGRLVASGSADMTIRLWDTATGAVRCTLGGHSDRVYGVAFSPDGRLVVSGLYDRTVRLWDTATGAVRRTLEGHPGTVYSVAFSPDGRLVASGSGDKTVRLWDAATGAVRHTLEGHSDGVYSVAFSPDGRLVASGSGDKTVRLWGAATGAVRRTLESHSNPVTGVAFSPDGQLVASDSSDKTVRLWEAATGALRCTLEGHLDRAFSVAFSPDSRLVASGSDGKTARLWDTATGAVCRTLEGHSGIVYSVAFSPDGRLVASGSYDKTVRLWDTATGAVCRTLEGHSGTVYSVAFSPDGRLVASGSQDMTVRLWSPV